MSVRNQSFLLQSFTEFYRLVAGIKTRIQESAATPPGSDQLAPEFNRLAPKAIADKLLLVLDRQATQLSGSINNPGTRLYQDARFVMVALADEMFLELDWYGRDEWRNFLLEEQVFHSQGAGDMLFRKLDKLLVEPGPGQMDLAKVYLMALALGFKGKFRHSDPEDKLHVYRTRLYSLIFKQDPQHFENEAYAFPQTYQHVIAKSEPKWLPTIERWQRILIGFLLGSVVVTHIIWAVLVGPLDDVVQAIFKFRS